MEHYSKVISGLSAYIAKEFAQPFSGSLKSWGALLVAGIVQERAETVARTLMANPIAQAAGLVNGESVDVELLYRHLLRIAREQKATVNVPMLGPVTFGEADVEALYRYIVGG